jgi:hypothetical protein
MVGVLSKSKGFLILFGICSLLVSVSLISIFFPIASVLLGNGFLMYFILSIAIVIVSFVNYAGVRYFELTKLGTFIFTLVFSIIISVSSVVFIYAFNNFLSELARFQAESSAGGLGGFGLVDMFSFGYLNIWVYVIFILIYYNLFSLLSFLSFRKMPS